MPDTYDERVWRDARRDYDPPAPDRPRTRELTDEPEHGDTWRLLMNEEPQR